MTDRITAVVAAQPDTPIHTDIEALWACFRDYVCKPYQANPERLLEVQHWFDGLHARRDKEGIELSFKLIERSHGEVAPSRFALSRLFARPQPSCPAKSFDAFCLNDQMFFSHDAAVMTLPYGLKDKSEDKSHLFVGVWLHDFGRISEPARRLLPASSANSAEWKSTNDIRNVIQGISSELSDKLLPGRTANIPHDGRKRDSWDIRVQSSDEVLASKKHRDSFLPNYIKTHWRPTKG